MAREENREKIESEFSDLLYDLVILDCSVEVEDFGYNVSYDGDISELYNEIRKFVLSNENNESRTCKNCKIGGLCDWEKSIVDNMGYIPKDFGCNKWVSK